MSDGASLEDFSLKVRHHKIMVASRAVRSGDNRSGLRSGLSYNNVTDEAFVSGVPLDAVAGSYGRPGISRLRMSGGCERPIRFGPCRILVRVPCGRCSADTRQLLL